MIKLSKAGKMPCRSWSLQAIDTCPVDCIEWVPFEDLNKLGEVLKKINP